MIASSEHGFSQSALLQRSPQSGGKTERQILWDQYGIPHIYGPDLLAVVQGYGYSQMENHAELILQKTAEARGRTAEYFGPGTQNDNVENDIRIQTYGIPERARRWYRKGGYFQQAILLAFVSGLNQYATGPRRLSVDGGQSRYRRSGSPALERYRGHLPRWARHRNRV